MNSSHSYLADAKEHREHSGWIQENIAQLYQTLQPLAGQPPPDEELVESLLIFFPYVTIKGNVREWVKLTNDAARNLYEVIQQPHTTLSGAYLVNAPDPAITANIEVALHRARKRLPVESLVRTYLTLLGLHIYRGINNLSPELAQSIILTARHGNRPVVQGQAYLMLAFADLLAGQYNAALKQAELAHMHARNINATREVGFSAYVMARVYRQLEQPNRVAQWMQETLKAFKTGKHHEELALATFEIGCNAFHDDEFTTARDYFEQAIAASRTAELPEATATYQQSLGNALMHLGEFDPAQAQLQDALTYWEHAQDTTRSLHVCQMLAKLAQQRNDTATAQQHLNRCEELLSHLYDNGELSAQMQQIRASLEQ